MKNIAYQYRVYPTEEQGVLFTKFFGCCRFIWNVMLADRIAYYRETGKTLYPTPAQYKEAYPFLREADSLALANVQLNLEKAFRNFFANPKKFRYPKFKSRKHSGRSYTTNNQGGTVAVGDNFIKLPKVGKVKAVIHRKAPDDWKLKSATVSQERDGTYYCSVLYEYETDVKPLSLDCVASLSSIGLDYKSDGLYVDSDGNCADMPKYYKSSQKRLARLQKSLSRKKGSKKGEAESNNHKKQAAKVAKLSRHVANQRKDFLHKDSAEKTNQYDVICIEDLDMKAMADKGFHNGKATYDNGWGMYVSMLKYKQEAKGHILVKVDKFFPSTQLCSLCGYRNHDLSGPTGLMIRNWVCPICGAVHDRDHNSAVNIHREGMRILVSPL